MELSETEYERIKNAQNEAFIRIDKNKDKIMEIITRQALIIEQVKDNKIEDLMTSEELNKKIKAIASNSGRKTIIKYVPVLIGIIEVIRQILERI